MTIQVDAPPLKSDDAGMIRVAGTRVTLGTMIGAFLDGASSEAIGDEYPAVSITGVYAPIAYYLQHRSVMSSARTSR